jgi:hypothetical protein
VIFLALNDLELENPVKSPFQFLEALNQEDLGIQSFSSTNSEGLLPEVVCLTLLTSLQPLLIFNQPY